MLTRSTSPFFRLLSSEAYVVGNLSQNSLIFFLADARVIESIGEISQMFFRTNKLCEIREQKACGDPCQYLLGHRLINTNAEPIPPLRGTEGLEICIKESSPLVWVLRSLPYSALPDISKAFRIATKG